jgi:hypothetical protein
MFIVSATLQFWRAMVFPWPFGFQGESFFLALDETDTLFADNRMLFKP